MSASQRQTLAERVAARSGVDASLVEAVLAAHAVPDSHVPVMARSLRVTRLRLRGTKAGPQGTGPFDATFDIPTGVVMAVGANLRGKTTLLEAITLCLRGEPRELQRDVAKWLSDVECDTEINGRPTGFRIVMRDGAIAEGSIVEATDLAALRSGGMGTKTVLAAASAKEYARAVDVFMLDRLSLEPLLAALNTGGVQPHRWASYFGALYPPAGREPVLIGETAMAGLAGRLLTVFLDLPGAALYTRVRAARDAARNRAKNAAASRTSDTERADARRAQLDALQAARTALGELALRSATRPASAVAADVTTLAGQLADAEAAWTAAGALHRQARAARQQDQRALNDHRESAVARALFHGLDPVACPRCEAPVATERRAAEAHSHICAVCTQPVTTDDDGETERETQAALEAALDASTRAAAAALEAYERAEEEVTKLSQRLTEAEVELREARDAATTDERASLELAAARAEGALAVLPDDDPVLIDPADTILDALVAELEADLVEPSRELFEELGAEIATLAREFGIESVTEIRIDRAARLKIWKGGADAGGFTAQSPGERLRLRIATVLALLRVGHRRGIATHPGLLMLDSLKAEEVQDSDAAALLDALIRAAAETPNLQVLTTSADQSLPVGKLPADAIIAPPAPDQPLW
ncbi:conserved hypothetical protein [Cellulomonas flavigena DSM 20109]|uniref:Rad50/SbcC-type AAA domain-containing protein n=1 Tax=Cellulomonas flavigena (strain ATCC 482 / DSM 20109 / BCRC 11376 / JCM 18109 / NBRC 3775 / NCIMB 8073 / NRS 134) TaxID=446466 RepID=D5UHS7_CELFN|nr:ATP-binding protein [Cellulomonas flavigena]ADG73351.1 conserved hypothetical protein [Cellulomonas flavigena DSM 20109]